MALAKSGLASQGQVEDLQRQLAEAVKSSGIYRTRWQELSARTREYMEMERLHPEETHAALESLKRLQTPMPEQTRVSDRTHQTRR